MPLKLCRDVAAADWITGSDLPWERLVTFGPAGFDAYARLRLLPDPIRPGQSENDADDTDAEWRVDQLASLLTALAAHTSTPDDCYFGVWDGFSTVTASGGGAVGLEMAADGARYVDDPAEVAASDAEPGLVPPAALHGEGGWAPVPLPARTSALTPPVVVPHREYWLFRGPLTGVGAWDDADGRPDGLRLDGAEPAFVWPVDRAWCVALDVDPHWAGIGASAVVIDGLVADRRLDVVPADPDAPQPLYR